MSTEDAPDAWPQITRFETADNLDDTIDQLDELVHCADQLEAANTRFGGGLESEIDAIRARLYDRRTQILDLRKLADMNDSVSTDAIIRLRPLLGSTLRERYGQRPGSAKHVEIDDVPNIRGNETLARIFLRQLVACLVPQASPEALALRIQSRTAGDSVTFRAEAGPARFTTAERARRDAAREPLEIAAVRQGWQVCVKDTDDDAVSVQVEALLAATPAPPPLDTRPQ